MSALALLARDAGFSVTGSDANVYSPVNHLLREKGITWTEGYEDSKQALEADCVIVGNAIKRGMPVIEAVLAAGVRYTSGPQWLAENILNRYRVLAVSGTHGKTTLTSMLAHILHQANLNPGFLIGGVDRNTNTSSRLGEGEWFVIEADEYDSAFFDKRPKFMHYRPQIAVLNNLEFDHADIYPDLAAIEQQFHYFLKTIPPNGTAIKPHHDQALNDVFARGQYSQVETFSLQTGANWRAELLQPGGQSFRVWHDDKKVAEVNWSLLGQYNVENALAAIAASAKAGVKPHIAAQALEQFKPVKRRLEVKLNRYGITVYDDFAHHPTAISKTVQAVKDSLQYQRVFVALELASYSMRQGVHAAQLGGALQLADKAYVLNPDDFNLSDLAQQWTCSHELFPKTDAIVDALVRDAKEGDAIVVMSNRSFDNIHQILSEKLDERFASV